MTGSEAPRTPSGLLVVDKDAGLTSHDVVARVRRLARTRRVGHAGTLDPMATGVLVVGIDRATRLLRWLTADSKTYEATMRLGQTTSTDDADGETVGLRGCSGLSDEALEAAIAPLRGDIWQIPSAVSAIKIGGRRAYALAREGVEVDIPARPVRVGRLDVVGVPREQTIAPEARPVPVTDVDLHVECSSGTYVRALARDIGSALGTGAHLTRLRRTEVGSFTLSDAETLAELTARVERGEALPLIGLDTAVRAMFPDLVLDEDEAIRFSHGQAPRRDPAALEALRGSAGEGPVGVLAPDGATVLGLARIEGPEGGAGALRTVLVF
ncbi:tRNA pseudouridine(55) synthase TruB [Schaalia naturae]|jgi:tRNA pseudouridine55 synthase|uniref:tRNA pseudouridine synthase B n=1 Tax=Schaalia naturae TaxID=635203 RepID=A0ABW2SMP3_9ACTO